MMAKVGRLRKFHRRDWPGFLNRVVPAGVWQRFAGNIPRPSDPRTRWSAKYVVLCWMVVGWSVQGALTERFREGWEVLARLFPRRRRPGTSYQSLTKATGRLGDRLLHQFWCSLRQSLPQRIGARWRWYGWTVLAVDGSRIDAPRTRSNERGLGRAGRAKTQPQWWVTWVIHLPTALIWDWRQGPGSSSERSHLRAMLPTLPENTLMVADTGFGGFDLLRELGGARVDFLIRCGSNTTLLVEGYPSADRTAGTTALCLPLAARSPCVPAAGPAADRAQAGRETGVSADQRVGYGAAVAADGVGTVRGAVGRGNRVPRAEADAGTAEGAGPDCGPGRHGAGREHSGAGPVVVTGGLGTGRPSRAVECGGGPARDPAGVGRSALRLPLRRVRGATPGGGEGRLPADGFQAGARLAAPETRDPSRTSQIAQADALRTSTHRGRRKWLGQGCRIAIWLTALGGMGPPKASLGRALGRTRVRTLAHGSGTRTPPRRIPWTIPRFHIECRRDRRDPTPYRSTERRPSARLTGRAAGHRAADRRRRDLRGISARAGRRLPQLGRRPQRHP